MIEYHKGNKPGKMPQQRMSAGIKGKGGHAVERHYKESFPPITIDTYNETQETSKVDVRSVKGR